MLLYQSALNNVVNLLPRSSTAVAAQPNGSGEVAAKDRWCRPDTTQNPDPNRYHCSWDGKHICHRQTVWQAGQLLVVRKSLSMSVTWYTCHKQVWWIKCARQSWQSTELSSMWGICYVHQVLWRVLASISNTWYTRNTTVLSIIPSDRTCSPTTFDLCCAHPKPVVYRAPPRIHGPPHASRSQPASRTEQGCGWEAAVSRTWTVHRVDNSICTAPWYWQTLLMSHVLGWTGNCKRITRTRSGSHLNRYVRQPHHSCSACCHSTCRLIRLEQAWPDLHSMGDKNSSDHCTRANTTWQLCYKDMFEGGRLADKSSWCCFLPVQCCGCHSSARRIRFCCFDFAL